MKETIKQLLDAAFRELQHDTGEQDPEYRYQRELLTRKFTKILNNYDRRKRRNESHR